MVKILIYGYLTLTIETSLNTDKETLREIEKSLQTLMSVSDDSSTSTTIRLTLIILFLLHKKLRLFNHNQIPLVIAL